MPCTSKHAEIMLQLPNVVRVAPAESRFGFWYQTGAQGQSIVCNDETSIAWLTPKGTDGESMVSLGCQ
jgi:hypothetical protein